MDRIRPLVPGDYRDAGRIFFCAVHEGTRNLYSVAQRREWGRETINLDGWKDHLSQMQGFVAEDAGEPIGFMTIDEAGYVDLAFVLPSCARRGVGARLLHAIEDWARAHGVVELTTKASLASRPFFARHGWLEVEGQAAPDRVTLDPFPMRKSLAG